MLRSSKEMKNYTLQAKDGKIGRCKDFLFDDQFWTVRYMVANTGKWLPGRKVLISPISLEKPDWVSMRLPVRLTKEQIEVLKKKRQAADVTPCQPSYLFPVFGQIVVIVQLIFIHALHR